MDAATEPAPDATADGVLALPVELTIYTVGELHATWRSWVQAGGCRVDGAAVDQVDAAGLQLLLALARSLHERGSALRLTASSPALDAGCAGLGLGHWLAEHHEGATA